MSDLPIPPVPVDQHGLVRLVVDDGVVRLSVSTMHRLPAGEGWELNLWADEAATLLASLAEANRRATIYEMNHQEDTPA